jgi:molybdate transport system permease protein
MTHNFALTLRKAHWPGQISAITKNPKPHAQTPRNAADGAEVMPVTPYDVQIILLTFEVAALAVVSVLPFALVAGWALSKRFRGRFLLNALVNLPLALPPVVTGWLLIVLCGAQGPVGSWLQARCGLALTFSTPGAALACAAMVYPLMVHAIRAGFEAANRDLLAAARSLGAGPMDQFFALTLPLAGPGIVLAIVTGFTASLGEFGAVITFAANVPGQTQTLPLAIYAALQTQDGATEAARLSLCAAALALLGWLITGFLGHRLGRPIRPQVRN